MPRGQEVIVKGCSKHFICECGYTANNKTGIRLHKRVTHGINLKDLDRDVDVYICKICKKTFDTTPQLLTHGRHAGHATY
jgi:hypothetical protein